jgi:hypothetical protein
MMPIVRALPALLATVLLLGAVPRHVLTGDYWGGYAGTHNLPARQAARWLWIAETDPQDSTLLSSLGVKTMLYTNPNREQPGDPMWTNDESEFAHTCSGERALGEAAYRGQILTDVGGSAMKRIWRDSVERHEEGAHFDFIFADEASGYAYTQETPCNGSFDGWLRDEQSLFASLHQPIIYNALNDFYDRGPAREIALNRDAAGGQMEECYAQLAPDHRVGGWKWWATEMTELEMAAARKYFICYGRDLSPADQAAASRLYTYASFLLSYDPGTTILWEYYKTPSGGHVMPESQLVALSPDMRVTRVAQLRQAGGAFARSYRQCYLDARPVGACIAVVNPDDDAHSVDLRAYHRVLRLEGSGIFDGGRAEIVNQRPPSSLAPLDAVIAFK